MFVFLLSLLFLLFSSVHLKLLFSSHLLTVEKLQSESKEVWIWGADFKSNINLYISDSWAVFVFRCCSSAS